ncbi:hypothetical protein FRC09_010230 [Ceratobasidium sp. 395]|nr:hypothetical protein FRC09_010230 [Ceratobasidium sp. 395]
MSALYSILILRGWDEVILCLRTVYSVKDIANYINDLTIDVAHLPESLNEMFYATLENALDKTRNLRRLAIIMDNNRKKIAPHLERALGQCRFRLHHFVYEGPSYPGHLSEFLDLQTSIRTLQIPYMDTPSSLPPYVTQLWVSFPLRNAASFQILSENLKCLSHFSFRGELSWAASRLRDHNIHYLAYDIAPWISSASSLPPTFRFHISGFSRLRILRLIGYWVICETVADATIVPQPENAAQPNQFGFPGLPAAPQGMDGLYTFIGYLIDAQSNDSTEPITTSPALYIEPAFLDILSHLPNLQALEVGSFAVRDAGRLRTRPGHTKHWLAQRLRWEDEFVHRVTSQASQRLAVVSFLACDEQLYGSCFQELPPRYRWGRYLQKVKKQIAQDDAVSGTTLPELISQTGLARWSGSASEPDNKCDYRLNSAFVPSILSRQLLEEVVTSEWVKAGTGNTWTRRLNVRNLRDIWPPGC